MKRLLQLGYETSLNRPFFILLSYLLVFALGRVLLFVHYADDFSVLTAGQLFTAFVRGMVFDHSIVMTFIGIPLLIMWLPFAWSQHEKVQVFWGWFFYALLLVMAFVLVGDVMYYGTIHRHAGAELALAMQSDMDLLFTMAFGSYLLQLVLFGIFAVALFYYWKLFFRIKQKQAVRKLPRMIGVFVGLVLVVVSVRGGVTGKPINIIDAYSGGSVVEGNLTLNGAYSIFRSISNSGPNYKQFFAGDDSYNYVKENIASPREQWFEAPEYPLQRRLATTTGEAKTPNIVIVMVESLDAIFIDSYRELSGLEPLNVTPNISGLAKQGLMFTDFFANGQRSIEGLTALIAALPSLPNRPNLAQGMAQSRLDYLGKMALSQGYQTYFLQSSPGHSNRMDSIAALAGFNYYAGAEKIPETGHIDHESDRWGWDYDMLFEANKLFAQADKPFLGLLFTSTTHMPYEFAGEKWRKYPDGSTLNDYLNALSYADWSIGEFIRLAKQAGYYDDTLFVFVGDHVSGQNTSSTVADQHRVGFIMLGKGIQPGVNRMITSQVDLIPSLVDLLNWPVSYSGVGHSVFDSQENNNASAILIEGNVIAGIDKHAWLRHSLKSVLESSGEEDAAKLEKITLAKAAVIAELLDENRMSSE